MIIENLMPDIKFVHFAKGVTEEDIINHMNCHTDEGIFLVYLRCKYSYEKEWEYIVDACCIEGFDNILWMHDWWEGQEEVEYLGITQLSYN